MSGDTTKFYDYKSSTSSNVTIPKRVAKMLNWEHKDEINIVVKTLKIEDSQYTGLFLFKKEKS